MYIKYGNEENLSNLMKKGEIYFRPAIEFRLLEEKNGEKGIGDIDDSGIAAKAINAELFDGKKKYLQFNNIDTSIIVQRSKKTPVFCFSQCETFYITQKERNMLRQQFPDHTHALIIEKENEFLENVRYSFNNKAFIHRVYYQDLLCEDYVEFLYSGQSLKKFYLPHASQKYYAKLSTFDNEGKLKRIITIDDSNFYKTMFRKTRVLRNQNEIRIVLPYEEIEKGKVLKIQPFYARIFAIDELVK